MSKFQAGQRVRTTTQMFDYPPGTKGTVNSIFPEGQIVVTMPDSCLAANESNFQHDNLLDAMLWAIWEDPE